MGRKVSVIHTNSCHRRRDLEAGDRAGTNDGVVAFAIRTRIETAVAGRLSSRRPCQLRDRPPAVGCVLDVAQAGEQPLGFDVYPGQKQVGWKGDTSRTENSGQANSYDAETEWVSRLTNQFGPGYGENGAPACQLVAVATLVLDPELQAGWAAGSRGDSARREDERGEARASTVHCCCV